MGLLVLFIPEEILPLCQLLVLCMGCEYGFERIGVVASIEHLSRDGHGCGGEVLHLFQLVAHLTRQMGQLSHVALMTTRMAGDEIRDELLVETFLTIDAVEDALELTELLERGLTHQLEHTVGCMLGCHLQASADMTCDQFACILLSGLVRLLVLAAMQQQVVAHATAYKTLLDAWQGINSMVDVKKLRVVCIEIRAYLRMDAGRTLALFAGIEVAPMHTVHIG